MRLAIKGHSTRGKEVIKLLEMLGGKNPYNYRGNYTKYYLISPDNNIYLLDYLPKDVVAYTLEEFEELYPHKVGDKVIVRGYKEQGEDEITSMIITYDNEVKYKTKNHRDTHYFTADSFKSIENTATIKEETMEERKYADLRLDVDQDDKLATEVTIDGDKITPPENYLIGKITKVDNGVLVEFVKKQPQYPKNYIECAKILDCFSATLIDGYKNELLEKLQVLLVCRDAYWKIAGEQMGLGKPWKPDWSDDVIVKYCIIGDSGVISTSNFRIIQFTLAFPTEEMRNEFYENFKDLIEECKELL